MDGMRSPKAAVDTHGRERLLNLLVVTGPAHWHLLALLLRKGTTERLVAHRTGDMPVV